jgi:hypothetical protein
MQIGRFERTQQMAISDHIISTMEHHMDLPALIDFNLATLRWQKLGRKAVFKASAASRFPDDLSALRFHLGHVTNQTAVGTRRDARGGCEKPMRGRALRID